MGKISIPQKVFDSYKGSAKEKNLIAAWDKYVDANKRHINKTLMYNKSRGDKELAFPLAKARQECGKIRINGGLKWVWDIFFPIHPFFKISQKGSSFTGKMTQILFTKKARLKEILAATTILEKHFPELTEAEISALPVVPIDQRSLRNYIKTTQSHMDNPELDDHIKDANQEYIKQAQEIIVCGGDKLDHGSGGYSFRGRSKTLPPVAFAPFGDGRWEDVHRGSLFTSSACLSC